MFVIIFLFMLFTNFSIHTMQKPTTAAKPHALKEQVNDSHIELRDFLEAAAFARHAGQAWKQEQQTKNLIKKGLPINDEWKEGAMVYTHLLYWTKDACNSGKIENVKFLLEHDAAASILHAPNNENQKVTTVGPTCKYTPLFVATLYNKIDLLQLFFAHNITIPQDQRPGLLQAAQIRGERTTEEVKNLLKDYWDKKDKEEAATAAVASSSSTLTPESNASKKDAARAEGKEDTQS